MSTSQTKNASKSTDAENYRLKVLLRATFLILFINSFFDFLNQEKPTASFYFEIFSVFIGLQLQKFLYGSRLFAARLTREVAECRTKGAWIFGLKLPPKVRFEDANQRLGRYFYLRLVVSISTALLLLYLGQLSGSISIQTLLQSGVLIFLLMLAGTPDRLWLPILSSILFLNWGFISDYRAELAPFLSLALCVLEILFFLWLQNIYRESVLVHEDFISSVKRLSSYKPWPFIAWIMIATAVTYLVVPARPWQQQSKTESKLKSLSQKIGDRIPGVLKQLPQSGNSGADTGPIKMGGGPSQTPGGNETSQGQESGRLATESPVSSETSKGQGSGRTATESANAQRQLSKSRSNSSSGQGGLDARLPNLKDQLEFGKPPEQGSGGSGEKMESSGTLQQQPQSVSGYQKPPSSLGSKELQKKIERSNASLQQLKSADDDQDERQTGSGSQQQKSSGGSKQQQFGLNDLQRLQQQLDDLSSQQQNVSGGSKQQQLGLNDIQRLQQQLDALGSQQQNVSGGSKQQQQQLGLNDIQRLQQQLDALGSRQQNITGGSKQQQQGSTNTQEQQQKGASGSQERNGRSTSSEGVSTAAKGESPKGSKASSTKDSKKSAPNVIKPKAKIPEFKFDEKLLKKIGVMLAFIAIAALIWFLLSRTKAKSLKPKSEARPLSEPDPIAAHAEFRRSFRDLVNAEIASSEDGRQLVIRLYNALLEFFGECGAPRFPHITPDEFMVHHYAVAPSKHGEMQSITSLFCKTFYGKQFPTGEELKVFIRCVDLLGQPLNFSKRAQT